jgi:hypothetical protein
MARVRGGILIGQPPKEASGFVAEAGRSLALAVLGGSQAIARHAVLRRRRMEVAPS